MKICITADWHINKDNRLEDTERTINELVQKVISVHPDWFVFLGDAYKNWRPTPLEMNIFHRAICDIASQKIEVFIVVGNHDYPENAEYKGKHCYTEISTLTKNHPDYIIRVVDEPSVMVGSNPQAIFIPYLPKSTLTGTYNETFSEVLKQQVSQLKSKKVLLFSHLFLNEAKIGAGDIEIISTNQVSADMLRECGIQMAFFGDIHKAQKIDPFYFYPGSIERIDFGERDDTKGFIVYKSTDKLNLRTDFNGDEIEFVELHARKLEQVVIDLVNPGLIKVGLIKEGLENVDEAKSGPVQDPYGYIIEYLDNNKEQLKDAVVKIKIICTKEQKLKIDDKENKIVSYLLDVININSLKSFSYELTDSVAVRNTNINESLDPVKALHLWIGMQTYKEDMAQYITLAGENILKGHGNNITG